jgi:hypothetical protein
LFIHTLASSAIQNLAYTWYFQFNNLWDSWNFYGKFDIFRGDFSSVQCRDIFFHFMYFIKDIRGLSVKLVDNLCNFVI